MARLAHYTRDQMAGRLRRQGFPAWQIERAFALNAMPAPDASEGRWSAALVDALTESWDDWIVTWTGAEEPVSSSAYAQALARATGLDLRGDHVRGLDRRGLLYEAGRSPYHDVALYDLREIPRLAALPNLAVMTAEDTLLGPESASERLGVRRTDFNHCLRLRWITCTERVETKAEWRQILDVALYRTADVDALPARAAEAGIDWDTVRAAPSGSRSPLARISTPAHTTPRSTK